MTDLVRFINEGPKYSSSLEMKWAEKTPEGFYALSQLWRKMLGRRA